MSHLNTAYWMGAWDAKDAFEKHAQGEVPLGDPNFWQGGTPPAEDPMAGGGGAAPASAEETIGLLPAGSFQGLQTKVTPDGQKTVSVKVTPDALQAPDALSAFFTTGENTKIEVASPDLSASATSFNETQGSDIPIPQEGMEPLPPGPAVP